MRRLKTTLGTVILLVMILVSACAPRSQPLIAEGPTLAATSEPTEPAATEEATEPAATEEATEPAASDASVEPQFPVFDAANFENSTDINNDWMPMKPGTFWAYEGTAVDDEGNTIDRRIEFTVTDLTKDLGGIRTVVGYDQDINDGELSEPELIFLAQANDGTIWHFGQYRESFEDGELVGGQTWLAGYVDGAKPGIMMPAQPQAGTPEYSEGFAPPPFFWDDHAQIDKVGGQKVCVKAGCYDDVIVIKEFEPRLPGIAQLKYWAKGAGCIKVGYTGPDPEKEELELTKVNHLSGDELTKIRNAALTLEYRAFVYGRTPPLEQRK